MISFSINEYLSALFSAFIYGTIFSVFECAFKFIIFFSRAFAKAVYDGFFYKGRLRSVPKYYGVSPKLSAIVMECLSASRVILFCLGFVIQSYIFLDGELRLFTLVFSILGFCLTSRFISGYVLRALKMVFSLLLRFFVLLNRFFSFIPRVIILAFMHKFSKICKFFKHNDISC